MRTYSLIVTLFYALTFISCAGDDNSADDPVSDPIVGNWQFIRVFDLNINGEVDSEENFENCDRPTILILDTNGTISGNGNCFEDGITYEGSWSKLSAGKYQIDALEVPEDGDTRALFADELTVNFIGRDRMQWTYIEESGETIYFEFRRQQVF